jgi:hypothetical protein
MSTRVSTGVMAITAVMATIAVLCLSSTAIIGQSGSYQAPRTPWGDPDLQGVWNGNDLQGVPFERAESLGTRAMLNDEEYEQRVSRRNSLVESDNADFSLDETEKFESFGAVGGPVSPPPHWLERANTISRQASFVVDPPNGRLPELTATAQQRQQADRMAQQAARAALGGSEAHTYTDRSLYDRCISFGPMRSITPKIYNSGNRIVQGPGFVAFTNEMIHETRIIPTDGRPHVGADIKTWMGNSVGHWEGETLVVETKHIKPEINFQGAPLSDGGRLIERFTRVADDALEYTLTVDDPANWTGLWTMMMRFPLDNGYGLFEYACHEGNYTMFNILSGARAQDKDAR